MSTHHLKINTENTELLFLQGKGSPTHDLTTTFDNSVLAPTLTARNLWVILNSQLSLTAQITVTARSCRIQENMSSSYSEGGTGSGPGSGRFTPRLL